MNNKECGTANSITLSQIRRLLVIYVEYLKMNAACELSLGQSKQNTDQFKHDSAFCMLFEKERWLFLTN